MCLLVLISFLPLVVLVSGGKRPASWGGDAALGRLEACVQHTARASGVWPAREVGAWKSAVIGAPSPANLGGGGGCGASRRGEVGACRPDARRMGMARPLALTHGL
jgi:hypothetical protein